MAASRRELANQAMQLENQILVSLAELRIRANEAEIALIEMEVAGSTGSYQADKGGPKIRKVHKVMLRNIENLVEVLDRRDDAASD